MDKVNQLKTQHAKEDDEALDRTFYHLCSKPDGRKFIWWLLQQCGYGNDPALTGDPYRTMHAAGQNSIALLLVGELSARNPEGFIALQLEMYNEHRTRTAAYDAADNRSDPNSAAGDTAD